MCTRASERKREEEEVLFEREKRRGVQVLRECPDGCLQRVDESEMISTGSYVGLDDG